MSQIDTVGELSTAAAAYLVHLERVPCSPKTIISYSGALRPFLEYCSARDVARFEEITRAFIEEWQDYLALTPSKLKGKPLALRSRSVHASVIRSFFQWSAKTERCDAKLSLWLDKVKLPDLEPRPVRWDVMLRLRVFFLDERDDPEYLLERAMFFFITGTGCRIAEALRVPRSSWQRATVIQKGGSRKTVICPDYPAELMRKYLATRTDSNEALFVRYLNHGGRRVAVPVTSNSARRIWIRLCEELGVPGFTSHQLRHTAASAMLAAGVDAMTVTNFMGHKSPATLRIYGAIPESQRQLAALTMNHFLKAG